MCFCCFSMIFLGRISLVFICSKSQNVKFAIWLLKSWFLCCFFFFLAFSIFSRLLADFASFRRVEFFIYLAIFGHTWRAEDRRRKAQKSDKNVKTEREKPEKIAQNCRLPLCTQKKKEKPCIYGLDGGRVFYQPHYIPHINSIQTAALYVFYVFLDLWVAMTRNWRGQRRVESVAAASIFVDTTNTLAPTEI